jgi:fumarylacetoacetate (FAA) hydrolase family protein
VKLEKLLPADWNSGTFLGRMDFGMGPTPVLLRSGRLESLYHVSPTTSGLLERFSNNLDLPSGTVVASVTNIEIGHREKRHALPSETVPRLLSPIDLQCIKAAGVTFAVSTLERVIEEKAKGDPKAALSLRTRLNEQIGSDIRKVRPGGRDAEALKHLLIQEGLWSQYLEVAIGPDAEIFTKGAPLSSVGAGDFIGIRSDSSWNNPEPELVIACDSRGQPRGATLGNDVNLRDFEGRSALLLGKAKDNNASCSIGPFIRLFDGNFGMSDVRSAEIELEVTGQDSFSLKASSNMGLISRDPADLIAQTLGPFHQYPDGFALFLGTMFAPIEDRETPGGGFTHKLGDVVLISNPRLGCLENVVTHCELAPPWTFGINSLISDILARQKTNTFS